MHLTILASLAAMATAMPSYIAVPADQIAFIDLTSLRVRRPRQTLEAPPPPQAQYEEDYQIPIQYQPATLPLPVQAEPPARIVQGKPAETSQASTLSAAAQYNERPPDFGEYVDFGAHTGDNGAFGWYADYPINNHGDNYRK